jgi:hypothetical protein
MVQLDNDTSNNVNVESYAEWRATWPDPARKRA